MVPNERPPEEELLRIIEGPEGKDVSKAQMSKISGRRAKDHLRSLWAFLQRRPKGRQRPRKRIAVFHFDLSFVNRMLWVGLILFGAYLLFDFFLVQPEAKLVDILPPGSEDIAVPSEVLPSVTPEQRLKPFSHYLDAIRKKNAFVGDKREIAKKEKEEIKPPAARVRLEQLARSIVLVGIDWAGPQPQAMFEDSEKKKTFFIKEGEEINGMVLKEITRSGVKLGYQNEEIEIH